MAIYSKPCVETDIRGQIGEDLEHPRGPAPATLAGSACADGSGDSLI